MTHQVSTAWIRTTAKLVFGAFLFLFVTSFLALPCLLSGGGLFATVASAPLRVSGAEPAALASVAPLQSPLLAAASVGAPLPATPMSTTVAPSFPIPQASAWRPLAASSPARAVPPLFPAAPSCAEHKIFKPSANVFKSFEAFVVEQPLRFAIILVVTLGILAVAHRVSETARLVRRRWRRIASLPFATSDPPHLPYFSALRDA